MFPSLREHKYLKSMQSEKESGNMGKEVVFDYSKATGFISAEEMANFKKQL